MSFLNEQQVLELVNSNRDRYYVYSLNRYDKPFYIGKGKNMRIFSHEKEFTTPLQRPNRHKLNTLKNALIENSLSYSIFEFFDDPEIALNYEKVLIRSFKRENLTNLTDGGDGTCNMSQESINRMREKLIGRISPNLGRKFSEESKVKMSAAKLGKPAHNKNIPMSDETKAKMSTAKLGVYVPWNKGIPMSEEAKLKNSLAHKGHIVSDETRQKISDFHKNATLEFKQKRIELNKLIHLGTHKSKEAKEKSSISNKNHSVEKVKLYNLIKSLIFQYNLDIDFPRYGKSMEYLQVHGMDILKQKQKQ